MTINVCFISFFKYFFLFRRRAAQRPLLLQKTAGTQTIRWSSNPRYPRGLYMLRRKAAGSVLCRLSPTSHNARQLISRITRTKKRRRHTQNIATTGFPSRKWKKPRFRNDSWVLFSVYNNKNSSGLKEKRTVNNQWERGWCMFSGSSPDWRQSRTKIVVVQMVTAPAQSFSDARIFVSLVALQRSSRLVLCEVHMPWRIVLLVFRWNRGWSMHVLPG